MNASKLFDFFSHTEPFNPKLKTILDNIMNISNPMECTDEMATDAQLEEIEDEMDRIELKMPEAVEFVNKVKKLKPSESSKNTFI